MDVNLAARNKKAVPVMTIATCAEYALKSLRSPGTHK